MKTINKENVDILCDFIFNNIAIRNEKDDEFPKNLKFVFDEEDIELFNYLINNKVTNKYLYQLYQEDIEKILGILRANLDEYLHNRDENINYIYVDDITKFSNLITELYKSISNGLNGSTYNYLSTILDAIWLRMSANDYDDIYKFLEKQIKFNNSKYFTVPNINSEEYYKPIEFCDFIDYKVNYFIRATSSWYETNRKISLYIEDKNNKKLALPEIYFNVIDEDLKKTCYLYAIQTPKINNESNLEIENSLVDIKKKLRNKYVNYKFILALHFFIEIMKKNNIYDIKVPLLQIFNYDYHLSMSDANKRTMKSLKKVIDDGYMDEESVYYKETKKVYDNVVDKEDIISKNKTERLVEIFMILEEKLHDIEILTDPYIEDENLIVKVLKK